jgi:hypothetical protein
MQGTTVSVNVTGVEGTTGTTQGVVIYSQLALNGRRAGLQFYSYNGTINNIPAVDARIYNVTNEGIGLRGTGQLKPFPDYYTIFGTFSPDLRYYARVIIPISYFSTVPVNGNYVIDPAFANSPVTIQLYATETGVFVGPIATQTLTETYTVLLTNNIYFSQDSSQLIVIAPTGPPSITPVGSTVQINGNYIYVYSIIPSPVVEYEAPVTLTQIGFTTVPGPFTDAVGFTLRGKSYVALAISGIALVEGGVGIATSYTSVGPFTLQIYSSSRKALTLLSEAFYTSPPSTISVQVRKDLAYIVNSGRAAVLDQENSPYRRNPIDIAYSKVYYPPLGSGDGYETKIFSFDGKNLQLSSQLNQDFSTGNATYIPKSTTYIQAIGDGSISYLLLYRMNSNERRTHTDRYPSNPPPTLYNTYITSASIGSITSNGDGTRLLVTGQEQTDASPFSLNNVIFYQVKNNNNDSNNYNNSDSYDNNDSNY